MTDAELLHEAHAFVVGMVGLAGLVAAARVGIAFVWAGARHAASQGDS